MIILCMITTSGTDILFLHRHLIHCHYKKYNDSVVLSFGNYNWMAGCDWTISHK